MTDRYILLYLPPGSAVIRPIISSSVSADTESAALHPAASTASSAVNDSPRSDRYIRLAISHARRKIPILNMQKGDGYFIPDMNDPEDVRVLVKYVRQEESRLKSIGWSLKAARQTLKNCGIDWSYESREYEISGKESG